MAAASTLRITPKARLFLVAAGASLLADQLTKSWIVSHLHYGERLPLIAGLLDLTHVRNPGGAFSFLAWGPPLPRLVFFIGGSLVAIAMILLFFRRLEPEARTLAVAFGLVFGGALGNLIDRFLHGEVIDFLDVHLLGGMTWPTFNLADSSIVVGVSLLIVDILFHRPAPADAPHPETLEDRPPG